MNVAAERKLDIDGGFRRKEMGIAVQVRLEQHALVGDFAQRIETEDLKSAGIGRMARGHDMNWCRPPSRSMRSCRAAETDGTCWRG